LKSSLKDKEFNPNVNYDLAEKIKIKKPKLYKKIIKPKSIIEYFISA
jgi:hypothetical protein